PDTGSLRGDLVLLLEHTVEALAQPLRKGVARVVLLERAHPELEAITRTLREEHMRKRVQIVDRALRRGELPPGADPRLIIETLLSAVHQRALKQGAALDAPYLEALVDLVLRGAQHGGGSGRSGR